MIKDFFNKTQRDDDFAQDTSIKQAEDHFPEFLAAMPLASATPTPPTPIVPRGGEHGIALGVAITIMSFLACLTLGGVSLITSATQDWKGKISREATIQIIPIEGIDIEQSLQTAHSLVSSFAGVADAHILNKDDTQKLIEPWLGDQAELLDLELPRLILVRFRDDMTPDIDFMRATLQQDIEGATFDDHRMWLDRLSSTAHILILASTTIFILTLVTMMVSVFFATRATLLMNAHIIEVLHFIGADARFVARQFDGYFLKIGLKGGCCGALLAAGLFWLLKLNFGTAYILAENHPLALLFGSFTLGFSHIAALGGLVLFVAAMAMLTSRSTVIRQLHAIDRRQDYS